MRFVTYHGAMASHALKQSSSRERKLTLGFLIAATIIAVVAAFGPLWMVRVGLAVAMIGCALSVWYSFKEIARIEVIHRKELKAMRDQAVEAAHEHHVESMDLIETFTARYKAHGEQLASLRSELSGRKQELSTLRGNLASATAESDRRANRIAELEAQLAARMDELAVLEARIAEMGATEGELVSLPRRRSARTQVPTAAELWSDGNHPTVVDLALLNLPVADERKHA